MVVVPVRWNQRLVTLRRREELVFGCGSGLADSGTNAAARSRDLLIRRAGGPQFVFVDAIRREHGMRVGIDEARENDAAAGVDDFVIGDYAGVLPTASILPSRTSMVPLVTMPSSFISSRTRGRAGPARVTS